MSEVENSPVTYRPNSMRERCAVLGIGLLGNQAIVWAFDYALYPYVMWQFGLLYGCIIMTALSALICYLSLLFYDWTKKDWLGIEAIKELKDTRNTSRLSRLLKATMHRSDWLALLILSVYFDPFITIAYLRPGSYQFNGLSRRDWQLFWASVLIANIWWSFVAFTGVNIIIWAWENLGTL